MVTFFRNTLVLILLVLVLPGGTALAEEIGGEELYTAPKGVSVALLAASPDLGHLLAVVSLEKGGMKAVFDGREFPAHERILVPGGGEPVTDKGHWAFAAEDKGRARLFLDGLASKPYDRILAFRHTDTGILFSAQKSRGYYLVTGWITGGAFHEETLRTFDFPPVFDQDLDFLAYVRKNGVTVEGPTFSLFLPLDQLSKTLGLPFAVPDAVNVKSGQSLDLAVFTAQNPLHGQISVFAVTVPRENPQGLQVSPLPEFRPAKSPVAGEDGLLAFVLKTAKGEQAMAGDLKTGKAIPGPEFEKVSALTLSREGQIACAAQTMEGWRVYHKTLLGPVHEKIFRLGFSPDQCRVAGVAAKGGGEQVILDGTPLGPRFDHVGGLAFAKDHSLEVLAAGNGQILVTTLK